MIDKKQHSQQQEGRKASCSVSRIFLLLLFVAAVYILTLCHSQNFSSAVFQGKTIKIDRNNYGIATIHASSIEQYLYALGTVLAEDRLFQISLRAYSAQGRLAESLGERLLDYDRFMREVNLKGWGDKRAARFASENPAVYSTLSTMALGINERVAQMSFLPLEFYLTGMRWENFTVNHLFYIDIQMEWSISMSITDEYTRSLLLNNYTQAQVDEILPNKKEYWAFDSVPIVTDDEIPEKLRTKNLKEQLESIKFNPLSVKRPIELDIIEYQNTIDASNAWAVRGEHTETGLPVLSNDPHLQSISPSHWYQFIVNYTTSNGSSWLSSGYTNPGNPRFFGKNPYFATAVTVCHGDNQDLFRETIDGDKYFVDGSWRDLKTRSEIIKIKSGSGVREEVYTVKETHRGPIIHYIFNSLGSFKFQDENLSLAWTGFHNEWETMGLTIDSFLISNFSALQHFLQNRTKTFYNANMLVITADNHIVMQQGGLHPIRRNPATGNYIKDGTTSDHDWVGVVSAENRMYLADPPKGYIIHANNRVAGEGYYGGYLNYTIFTARADRIDELIRAQIASGRKIGKEFMEKVLYDTVDVYCRQILPEILAVVEDARLLLHPFDCNFSTSSYRASLYEVFMFELYQLMKPLQFDKMSLITFHQMQQGLYNYIHSAHRGNVSKQATMRAAWPKVLTRLQKHFGTEDHTQWQWGSFHHDTNRHLPFRNSALLSRFYDRESPGFGNFHTPNVGKMEKLEFGNFDTTHRANIRLLFGFGEGFVDEWIVDGGASESVFSSHYSDQLSVMAGNRLIPVFGEGVQNTFKQDL